MLLLKGSRGNDVKKLQNDLIELGFGEYLKSYGADSIYGDATGDAVEAFQKWAGIKVDRKAGNQTLGSIRTRKSQAGNKGTYNFNITEFYSKDGGGMRKGGMSDELMHKLERLRYECGNKAMIITSGYRTSSHNRAVGGASKSQHLYGRAADLKVRGVSASTVYSKANRIFSNGGVGKYSTFTHVDTRGYKARF